MPHQNPPSEDRAQHQEFPAISVDRKIENVILSELGYDLTVEEIAERLGISEEVVQALVRAGLKKR